MPTYKLTYFNITGLGEPIRFLFHYGGVDFEDVRVEFADWPQLKSKMPMEQMPLLEIDGKPFHQSRAISRHLAKKFNLYGKDDLENILVDASVDDIEDWRMFLSRYFREEDAVYKEKMKAVFNEKTPFFLGKFEEQVKKNGGFFVNNRITWPDIHFTAIVELVSNATEKDVIQNYPALKKLYDTVRSNPKIKAYLEKRPKTKF